MTLIESLSSTDKDKNLWVLPEANLQETVLVEVEQDSSNIKSNAPNNPSIG